MQLLLKDDLPFVAITLAYRGATIDVPHVLIDTGSATTVISADVVEAVQIKPSAEDILLTIRGIGGSEVVFTRTLDYLKVGERSLSNFEIEVSGMDYGFEINGILGMDFLTAASSIINLHHLQLEFAA